MVGASSLTPKGWGFDPGSRHTPKLQVQSVVGTHLRGNQLNGFFSPSFSLFLKSINISSDEDFLKRLKIANIYLVLIHVSGPILNRYALI